MQQHCPHPDWIDRVVVVLLVEVEDGSSDQKYAWGGLAHEECVRPITDVAKPHSHLENARIRRTFYFRVGR